MKANLRASALLAVPLVALLAGCPSSPSAGGSGSPGADGDGDGDDGGQGGPGDDVLTPEWIVFDHPCPEPGAWFGHATAPLDFDGDGQVDLAVGAPGQDAVFVFLGPLEAWAGSYLVLVPGGLGACPPVDGGRDFGFELAAGELDGDPADELVVGAPLDGDADGGAVYVFGLDPDLTVPARLTPGSHPGRFGTKLTCGDYDGDGWLDLAVGAVAADVGGEPAGVVLVHPGPLADGLDPVLVPNPAPADQASFGVQMATVERPGADDLVVSAIGNDSVGGVPKAGQVYRFPGPLDPLAFQVFEDPQPDPDDPPRFGMHLAARAGALLVGAPRKDLGGLADTGEGFAFLGPGFQSLTLLVHPTPTEKDKLGYRTAVADLVGSPAVDLLLVAMPPQFLPGANPRAALVWDGADPGSDPFLLEPLEDSASHYAQGLSVGPLVPGGRDELVLGDHTWDFVPGDPNYDSGRVVIYVLGD